MKQFELTCAECGTKFIEEADCDVPGVQGQLITSSGNYIKIIDSTEPHYCTDCARMRIVKLMYETYKIRWCEDRGYNISDVNEEVGINGECYVCFDEWYNNELQKMLKGGECNG